MHIDPLPLAVGIALWGLICYSLGWVVGNGSADAEVEEAEAKRKADLAQMRKRFQVVQQELEEARAAGRLKL